MTVRNAKFALALVAPLALTNSCSRTYATADPSSPNVLLISIDDLNDWIGCLGGHPQAKTPNLDALASRGVLFTNAHCQAPVCNPSRASVMTSLYPETSGIYFLSPGITDSPVARQSLPMPVRFEREGYEVAGGGKVFHNQENARFFSSYAGSMGGVGPKPKQKLTSEPGYWMWDWGAYPIANAEMPDHRLAQWAADELRSKSPGEPFFLAVGFSRPHVPLYAPQEWFDAHPRDEVELPKVVREDLADLPQYAINLTRLEHIAPTQKWMEDNNESRHAVQSYLASVSFVDACVGMVMRALDASPVRDNTIVLLFSDHGIQLGEKERWGKRSLWEDCTRVPLMVIAPGRKASGVCHKPVELTDIYPTLLALTGLKPDARHEGHSLIPLLEDQQSDWPHMARTTMGPGNVTVRSERYRYIRYLDGSVEFYDHESDPDEWRNLASKPEMQPLIAHHAGQLPTQSAEILGSGSLGHRAYEAAIRASEMYSRPLTGR